MTTALAQSLHDIFGIWGNFPWFFSWFFRLALQEKTQNNYGTRKRDAIHLASN